jgi:hypothetical protein
MTFFAEGLFCFFGDAFKKQINDPRKPFCQFVARETFFL